MQRSPRGVVFGGVVLGVVVLAATLLAAGAISRAESPPPSHALPPSYVVVQSPAILHHNHHITGYYPGHPLPVSQHAYAYGWFGATPTHSWHKKMRHNGFRNDYSQWSFR